MTKELNTLLTALYVVIDDHVAPPRAGRGRRPELSDSELITLAVAQVLLGFDCERRWIRHLHASPLWRAMFPYLPKQSGLPQAAQGRAAVAVPGDRGAGRAVPVLVRRPVDHRRHPGALRRSRETAKRSELAGHAGYGYCASHSRYYWGLKLYLVCAGDGMPIMWCLANPKIGEREVLAALLEHNHHLIRAGQITAGRQGLRRSGASPPTPQLGLRLLRPDRKDETYRNGNLGGVRQWIESVNQTLKGQLGLEHHGGRTLPGVFTRIAQRLLAMAAGIWHNWTTGITSKRSLTAYDH